MKVKAKAADSSSVPISVVVQRGNAAFYSCWE